MPDNERDTNTTLALNTKLEADFVSPLTAVRGALEILRDHPDMSAAERQRFVSVALSGCNRLKLGIEQLAESVYAAAQRSESPADTPERDDAGFGARIRFLEDIDAAEIDLSGLVFSSAKIVNDFYDFIDGTLEASGRSWFLLVNYRDCSIWPEAWVAFAHRGKKTNTVHSIGTVRYDEPPEGEDDAGRSSGWGNADPNMFSSRELAIAHIEAMRESAAPR